MLSRSIKKTSQIVKLKINLITKICNILVQFKTGSLRVTGVTMKVVQYVT